ncbi:hypothetical protein FD827_27455 [Klebsiella pneumoniae]|uniref:hypothetical protein n=1 Tax=Klebsiella pneumoniae TaxID=573 RepID=UPI000FB2D45B|nr:hypothetical protein [Klebsiella pneumoniae]EEH8549838.1 hypothetical protein [Salmonella enterica]EFE7076559.1 hypothetical protein [Escherichia coli]MBQ5146263.1 hypothetical protein [Klebsiella pneumoniae]MGR63255.1 hypothetical protein [Escherichia coli]CAH6320742.1 hypothetical protein AN2352V1_2046 [Klebsiella pneumoniae]
MKNMLFSPGTASFFLQGMDAPADAVEVSTEVEAFLRQAIIWGAEEFHFSGESVSVTYPGYLQEYATDNKAPTQYPAAKAS